jgi:hypothetical protein
VVGREKYREIRGLGVFAAISPLRAFLQLPESEGFP